MKQKTRFFFLAFLFLLCVSQFTPSVVGQTGYSTQKEVIASWLNAKLVGINDNAPVAGTDQSINGLNFRVMLGGYRLYNTQDFGKITLGKDPNGNTIYGYYRRYNVDFDILIRTLATRNNVVNPSVTSSPISGNLADMYMQQTWLEGDVWDHTTAPFSVPNYNIGSDWRNYAGRIYTAALKVKLEMNPSFEFPDKFSVSTGTYELSGMWAGIVFVKNPSTVAFTYGLLKDNIAISTVAGTGTDSQTQLPTSPTGGETPQTGVADADTYLTTYAELDTSPDYYDESEGSLVDFVYNTPNYEFDLYEVTNKAFDFRFDPTITNKNYSAVWFPYTFRLKPETTIKHSVWTYDYAEVYINAGTFGGLKRQTSLPDQKIDAVVAWKVDNVFQKQSLRASIDIISKYEFTPTMEDGTPLEDPEEFVNQSLFGNVATGASSIAAATPSDNWLENLFDFDFGPYMVYLYIAIGVVVLGIVLYFWNKRRQIQKLTSQGSGSTIMPKQ